jgi:hypothetical protein
MVFITSTSDFIPGSENRVNQTVFYCFIRTEKIISVRIPFYRLYALAGMLRHKFIQAAFEKQDFLGVYFDIRSLPLKTAHWLMDHHPRIGKAESLPLCSRRQQQ